MMRLRRRTAPLLLALPLLAACGGGEPTQPPAEIVGVQVTPATARLEFLGATLQLSARVFRDDGSTVAGAAVTWSTSDPTVTTVSAGGLLTATGAGGATVTATYESFSASTDVIVTTPDCVNEVNLAAGEWEALAPGCVVALPAGAAGDRYRVAIVNQGESDNSNLVTTATLGAVAISPEGAPLPAPATPVGPTRDGRPAPLRPAPPFSTRARAQLGDALAERTAADHFERRAREVELFERIRPSRAAFERLQRRAALRVDAGAAATDSPSRITVRINPGSSCTLEPATPALLIAENDLIAVYQDSTVWAQPDDRINATQAQAMLDYYETHGKAVIDAYFGGVPDLDGNGKVLVVATDLGGATAGGVAAYVWGGDLFPRDECETSNEGEITYFNSKLIQAQDDGFFQSLDATVHEIKHIASFWQGLARSLAAGTSRFQPSWIEEGAAEIAAMSAGRRAWAANGGPQPFERADGEAYIDTGIDENRLPTPWGSPFAARMRNAHDYLVSQPNGVTNTPFGARSGHDVYGSGWTFMRWLGDAYGNATAGVGADAAFYYAISDSLSAEGVAGIEAGTGKSWGRLLEEYAAAIMFHMNEVRPADIDFKLYDFVSGIEGFCFAADNPPCEGSAPGPAGSWPWPVTTSSDGEMAKGFTTGNFTGPIGVSGIRVHEFVSAGTNGLQLTVDADQPSTIVVVRLN